MKNIKLATDKMGEIYDARDGACDVEFVDYKASPEDVLKAVDSYLKFFGLEVCIGSGIEDDNTYFKIEKKEEI